MITVVINGQDFLYPEVGDTDWGNSATIAFQSLVATTLQKSASSFTLENELDFGGANGIKVLFISSRSNDPAESGVFRLAKNELISWRNDDNTDDFSITTDPFTGDLLLKANGLDENNDPMVITRRVTVSGEIVNADIAPGAGIEESKLALDYSTDSLHTAIEDKAISNLKDTQVTSPSDNQALLYNANDSKWENRLLEVKDLSDTIVSNPNPGDILLYDGVKWSNEQNSVDALTDAEVLNPADGDVLAYNNNTSSWENSDKLTTVSSTLTTVSSTVTTHVADKNNPHETSLSNLKDTTISSPSNGDALTFDGNKWINSPSTSSSLSGLSDTDITTPANGDTLVYNSVSTKWENSDELSTVSSTVSSHVGNTSNPHSTSVSNLTDTTLSGLNYGDRLTYDSNTSKWFNQPNTLGALIDTGISSEQNGDALVYDGIQWINQENSVENLTNTNISNKADGDVLVYNNVNQDWENSNALTTVSSNLSSHTGNTSNPHSTSVDNLTDSDVDSDTLTDQDILLYNDQTGKWENSQALVNHIGNAANPHLTTVSKLTDTSITTPQNGDVLVYDYANTQWVNSQIVVNDIANINNSTTAIALTASDKRHQIFTATDGFNITLPSTGIKAGEKFVFEWSNEFGLSITNPFIFYSSDNTALKYAWINNFSYMFTALVDTPTSSSDWLFSYRLQKPDYHIFTNKSLTVSNQSSIAENTPTITNLKAGYYDLLLLGWTNIIAQNTSRFGVYVTSPGLSSVYLRGTASDILGIAMGSGFQYSWDTDVSFKPFSKRAICVNSYKTLPIAGRAYCIYTTNVSGTIYISFSSNLLDPITDNSIT